MRIHVEVTALPVAGARAAWTRYLCVLQREVGTTSWACSVHAQDEHGPSLARGLLAVEPAQLLPAVREFVLRELAPSVQPHAHLLLHPEAAPELKQRLALECARLRGWRAERCLGCMGSGVLRASEPAPLDGRCVLCAGHGLRYWRPGPRSLTQAPDLWSTEDVFAFALGAEPPGGETELRALAG